jgi:hypothetical protein
MRVHRGAVPGFAPLFRTLRVVHRVRIVFSKLEANCSLRHRGTIVVRENTDS